MKEYCTWIDDVCDMSMPDRQRMAKKVLDALRSFRKKDVPPKESTYLTDWLLKETVLMGFVGNVNYVNATKRKPGMAREQFENILLHALGSHVLLFKHKKLPLLLIVGPGIKLDHKVYGITD